MTKFFDAFISYGRADSKEFAIKLQNNLNKNGFQVWFDFNDIPLGVDFQNQIDDGIEKAENFLFVISPHSINSPYCRKEIELAIKCNKRIIPLLHVDQISRETWQQRNPQGTDKEWELYQAEGKHTCFQNMHPTIGKINWVFFQEGKNDFDKSLTDLINLLSSHQDYVEQHTRFLTKALEWERHQKQTSYLLVGEEKQQAEKWLKIRFKDEQPPCIPSDLHCEYITESIKNGNNLMTQVMLCYADEDRATMEKIRASLRREGLTVWTNTTDIQTGEDFVESIKQGIEKADNLVYLLSPNSIKSSYCQQELDLGVDLNKRIIPLLVQTTENLELPSALQDLQYIDFTDNFTEEDYQVQESQLLKILSEDRAYYNEHKILLTKAFKWQQQNHNPSILLRGYNLRSAQTWLETAQKRTKHPPIPLQSEFITASLQQPPLDSLDVFISYSRADSDLGRKLNNALQIQGKTTWFDQESIASGSDFQEEINRGIKVSDNFLFIISPRSVNSPYCQDEVEYAASLNKRFITVLHKEVDTSNLHPDLAQVQWIDFKSKGQDFNANFNQLLRTIETDREHVRSHSKWLQRSLEWEQKNKNEDLLLRGSEFLIAQNWLKETEEKKKKPEANILQQEFIQASQNAIEIAEKAEKRRQSEMLHLQEEKRKEAEARLAEQQKSAQKQKFFLVTISIAFLAAIGFSVMAVQQKIEAVSERKKAEQVQLAQLNSISQYSLNLSQENLKFDALLQAISAGKQIQELDEKQQNQETLNLVLTALQTAVYEDGFREQNRLQKYQGTVFDVAWSPDGQKIASASGDSKIKLWNLNTKDPKNIPVNDNNEFYSVSFSPDGQTIAFAGDDNSVRISNLNEKQPQIIGKHQDSVWSVVWSNDGKIIASASEDKTIKLWDNQGNLIRTLTGHQKGVRSVSFSPDGKTIASGSKDSNVKLWNVSNGQEITTIPVGENSPVNSISFSPDGKNIAFANNHYVRIWNLENQETLTIGEHDDWVWSVTWSPDGSTIASASNDNTVKIWDKRKKHGKSLQTLKGHNGSIKSVKFSPDGKKIATASEDNTVRLWSLSAKKLKKFKGDNLAEFWSVAWNPQENIIASGRRDNTIKIWAKQGEWEFIPTQIEHQDAVSSISFSPDGNTIASGSKDNTIKLWNNQGKLLQTLKEHQKPVWSVAWSPDGNTIASGAGDNTIKLWDKNTQEPKTLSGHRATVWSVAWSPDGNTIASGAGDNTVKLWSKQGKLLRGIGEHNAPVASVAWSPDGNTIASASNDNTIKLWNQMGEELRTLKGHQNDVLSVAFSPKGDMIASGSKDNTIKLWNLKGEKLKTLNGHNQRVTSVSFSPDGKTLTSTSDDKTLILWNLQDLTLDKLMQDACQQLEDYFVSNPTDSNRKFCQ